MNDFGALAAWLQELPHGQILIVVLLVTAIRKWTTTGIQKSRLDAQNRKLREAVQGYERMEKSHLELGKESRERNRFQGELPMLIARLNDERTLDGICRQLVDFLGRTLEATQVSLFLVQDGELVLREARGLKTKKLRIRPGDGIIGAVGQFKRVMDATDIDNLDPKTRDRVTRGSSKIDTSVAAPMTTHGKVIGVLNVGGNLGTATPSIRKEVASVVGHLGATAVQNQINFERLEREATTDGLTQLSNVRNFKNKANEELKRCQRFGRSMSVFLFDIDNFKVYNDQNGHPAGDECLRITAKLLRDNTRATDLPARYGGEEFIILLPETDTVGGVAFAEKIRKAIAETEYPAGKTQPLGCVSVSGGVATYPKDGSDLDALISAADAALYICKESGRNRVAAPQPKMGGDEGLPAPVAE